jgi:hypothetical protein
MMSNLDKLDVILLGLMTGFGMILLDYYLIPGGMY